MTLSPKALRFVVEALEYYLQNHDQRLRDAQVSDDDRADWDNDRRFIEEIRQECLNDLAHRLDPAVVEV